MSAIQESHHLAVCALKVQGIDEMGEGAEQVLAEHAAHGLSAYLESERARE